MKKTLKQDFFDRPALTVARELIGKYLVRRVHGKEMALLITETEAYAGPHDLACHSRVGKTARNAAMWGPPGSIYVYFTYGMHWMLNLVVREEGYGSAVLIRALTPDTTFQHSAECENVVRLDGPGRLTKALKIDKTLNGKKLGREAELWVEGRGVVVRARDIKRTPRIGIAYAGSYVLKPWRFVLKSKRART